MEPEADDTDFWGLTAGDLQSGVSVTGNAITGTLNHQADPTKALVNDWGAGYFIALKFSGFADGLTYENVQVGLDPSEGAGMVTLDSDCNGVFKITDKATQKLKVVQTDGTHTLTQTFDLSGLTLEEPAENTISPSSVIFDANTSSENYGDKVLTVTPAVATEKISKLFLIYDGEEDEIPKIIDGHTLWTLDNETELVITLKTDLFASVGEFAFVVYLTDDSTVTFTANSVDTTPQNTVSPASATFDLNPNGTNYGDKVFTVTPAAAGETITKVLDDGGDELPSEYGGSPLWTLDETELVLTLSAALVGGLGEAGETTELTIVLSDDSTVGVTITFEDTT